MSNKTQTELANDLLKQHETLVLAAHNFKHKLDAYEKAFGKTETYEKLASIAHQSGEIFAVRDEITAFI